MRSFRTEIAPPPRPALYEPAQGASRQNRSLTLDFSSAARASSYRVQISTSSSFSSYEVNTSTSATSRQVSGLSYGTRYYWRVRAGNSTGGSAWSPTWHFTTEIAPPPAAQLVSPSDEA